MHLLVTYTLLKKGKGVDQKTSQYRVWTFYLHSATHLLHVESIRLLIVACGMLSHSSSMAARELEHAVYTFIQSIPNMLNGCLVSMQAMEELGYFRLPEIVYRSL